VLVLTRPTPAETGHRWVVATRDVPAGTTLSAGDLGTVPIKLPDGILAVPEHDAERLVGRVTRTDLGRLSVLRPDDVWDRRAAPGDTVEVPITVESGRLPGDELRPGVAVDVLASDAGGTGTSVVATGVTVLGVDRRRDASLGGTDTVPVRLAVPRDSVAVLVDASVRAELTVVLPPPATTPGGLR
jgi:Flp pilus assembly protein CpaB